MVLRRPRKDGSVAGLKVVQSQAWQRVRRRLRKPVARGQWPGLAACVFVGKQLRMVEEAGYADVEAKVPMTRKTLVRLYSMTKCIVAAAVLQLVEAGHLKLEDELAQHLPCFANPKVIMEDEDGMPDFQRLKPSRRPILLSHLLTHTSGISCGLAPTLDGPRQRSARERAWASIYTPLVHSIDRGEVKSLEEWVHEVAKLPLVSHPGAHYGYGYSYDILGHLIELKSGQRLESYLAEHIFKPLGMRDSCFQSSRRLSVLYRRTKSKLWGSNGAYCLVPVDPEPGARSRWSKCVVPSAGGGLSSLEGGLLSTMDDYAKFLLAVTSGGKHGGARILSKASTELMMSDLTTSLGRVPSSARPYDAPGLGLSGLGEVQRRNAPKDAWFDGVPGVRQWGGAASCAFKFDPNKGVPILALVMTQALPQDDGATITTLLRDAREVIAEEL